jgi:GT2 family glycosyltransferase
LFKKEKRMLGQASIDVANRGVVSGWLLAEAGTETFLCVDGEKKVKIESFHRRQDVIDAGITDADCGFNLDVKNILLEHQGDVVLSIENQGNVLFEQSLTLPSNDNLIENQTFTIRSLNEIKSWKLDCYHRIGATFNSFIAPKSLKFSDGYYTRLSFADAHNTRSQVEITPEISFTDSLKPLQLALVAKASQETNLHIRIISKDTRSIIYDDIFTLSNEWSHHISNIPSEFISDLREGLSELKICTKHYGRRFVDFAYAHLAEDAVNIQLLERTDVTVDSYNEEIEPGKNLIINGDLSSWEKGIRFEKLNRVQELADNWFLEFSKTNKGKFAVAAVSDNSLEDPLQETLTSKFGLRVRANQNLDGYARIVLPFDRIALNTVHHVLSIDVEPTNLSKRLVLPRVYLVARDAVNETAVSDFARKQTVTDRTTLQFELPASQIEKIQTKARSLPVFNIFIDIPSGADFTIYSVLLKEQSSSPVVEVGNDSELTAQNIPFAFEDDCINQQLFVLKGLEEWATGKPFEQIPSNINVCAQNGFEGSTSLAEFDEKVFSLVPHKLARPSRNFPLVDIIVPVYNACDDVLLCLSALIEKTDLLHRVIVVNDGDDERTAAMLAAFNNAFNHLEVITNPQNMGYTKSVNIGVKHSNADWVVVLNSDTIVSEGWLGKLMNCALSEDNVGMVGALSNAASWQSVPQIHDKNGDWNLNPLPVGMSVDEMASLVAEYSTRAYPNVGVINGFCQLISMDLLDKIGLLDEQAFPVGYGEENDMCARAVKAGFKLLIADDTYVFHAKSKSFGHEKRKVLAKQGSAALKAKHPDVDWNAVTKKIFEYPALVELREELTRALSK